MKKFLCAIAMLVAFIPFVGVKAINETTNYYSYEKGQLVNFYPNATTEANRNKEALEVMIVEDKDTSNRFVKVWVMGGVSTVAGTVGAESPNINPGYPLGDKLAEWKSVFINFTSNPSQTNKYFQTGAENDKTGNYFLDFNDATRPMQSVTFADLKAMFGDKLVKNSNTKYTLNNVTLHNRDGKEVSFFDELQLIKDIGKAEGVSGAENGFYVLDTETPQMWIARYTITSGKITKIEITPADETADATTAFMYMPTMYANKTADCHETISMCYVCNGEYKWAVVGSQDASCTEYKDAKTADECKPTKCYKCVNENGKYVFKWITVGTQGDKCEEVTDITSKNDCSELVKTGVESHILEFAIVAALCVIALIVVKRKDLFKTI